MGKKYTKKVFAYLIFVTGLMALTWLLTPESMAGLQYPHNAARSVGCSNCHTRTTFRTLTSFNTMCMNQCHRSGESASKKALATIDASNKFGSLPDIAGKKQSSHGWRIPNTNPNAGATKYWLPAPEYGGSATLQARIGCTRCHRAHGDMINVPIYRSFLKGDPKGDDICFQCHAARRVNNVRDPLPAGKHYSHPVEVSLGEAKTAKPEFFESVSTVMRAPLPANYKGTARMRLYTTKDNSKSDAVVCSSCHGPLHSTDSNPYTFDNLTTYASGNYSTSDGSLLRRYPLNTGDDLCTACHKVKTHQGRKCGDCHEPHKKAGDNNIYLTRKVIAAPYGNMSVFFTSTTQMAKRFGIYSWSATGAWYSKRSNAICQVCHTATPKKRHRSYSTVGTDQGHKMYTTGGVWKSANCISCHPHNAAAGGFAAEGCSGCHEGPPDDAFGKHGKHTNSSARHNWADGTATDARSSGSYGFACSRCHNKWTPYTSLRHYPAGFSDSAPGNYTAEVDFKYVATLPKQDTTKATYTYGGTGGYDPGTIAGGSTWRAPSAGTCNNLYCHGQFYNGYTGVTPTWTGTQPCGSCHGVAQELGRGLPGNMKNSTNYGAHPRHVGGVAQQYGAGGNFRCNACHSTSATQNAVSSVGLDRRVHVNGRINVKFDAAYDGGSASYNGMNNYTAQINTTITKPAYKTCGLIYCHSDGSRMSNYSVPFNANQGSGTGRFPNWSSSRNFTTTVAAIGGKSRCARCHGNSTFKGITAAMPGVTGKPNSHEKHIRNGFLCYACHSVTVGSDSRSIASTAQHVDKDWDVNIISRYGGTYDSGTKTCSNVKCHGGRTTPAWGTDLSNRCQDCHYKSTTETTTDEGFKDNYAWKGMTSTGSVPRIYSGEWKKFGHGASASYPSSGNPGANKICTACHKSSGTASHQGALTNNPYRLITSNINTDVICKACHGTGAELGKLGMTYATVTGITQHSYSGMGQWGNATWQFKPKCIDCHDPHGDKNRSMIHAYINYSGSDTSGKRTYDQSPGSQMTFSTIGAQIRWSSYVKSDYSGLCQRCHNTQANLDNFNKAAKAGGGYKADHNSGTRCTDCHKHRSGFKGMNCNGCHNFPPTLSGKHSFHVATTVPMSYVGYENAGTTKKYAYGCGKCHSSGNHYVGVGGNYTTEVVFDSANTVPKNSGSYVFGAKSSIDPGADGAGGYSWTSTKGTCMNLYCHGQFFGGYSGNDPKWYNNGPDDPQTCGKCHGAVRNSSGYPSGGAHVKHLDTTKYNMPCKTCHRDVTGGFNSYTVTNRQLHVNGVTNIRLYTSNGDATVGSRIGRYAKYGNSANDFVNVTTNTDAGAAPTYRYCLNTYCHSRGTSTQNPYTSKAAYPNYTAQWGKTAAQITGAGRGCSLCHGNKTYAGITAAMPVQGANNSHLKHVIGDKFKCYVCHANVVDANGNITAGGTANHVNKFKNISIITTYKTGLTNYVDGTDTCENVKCHGGRKTPAWGSGADCRNCHLKSSAETTSDEGFRDAYAWKSMTSTSSVPKIYSSEWQKFGHGKYSTTGSGGRYPSSGNKAAGKVCADCHKASSPTVGHSSALSGNQYRLYTTPDNIDFMCKECHTATGGKSSQATTRVKGHSYAEMAAGNAAWQFTPKCIDCHDPHGDRNRYMVQQFVNYSGSDVSGKRTYDQNPGAQMIFSTIGAQMRWSSYVKNTYDGICQRCHNTQQNMTNFSKDQFNRNHNSGSRCTSCHKHSDGFKGSGCGGCHNFPPTLSGKHALHVATSVNQSYLSYDFNNTASKYAYGCGKCHDTVQSGGSHYSGSGGNYTTELVFDSGDTYPRNSHASASYTFGGKSSIDPGADGAGGYSWTSTKGTCKNLYCHGQFFGGITSNDPLWYGTQTCGVCHRASSLNPPTAGAHSKHVGSYKFDCRNCHNDTVQSGYSAPAFKDKTKHVNGKTDWKLYTGWSARIGGAASYRGVIFGKVTTLTTAPAYGYCQNLYCHSKGTDSTNPYSDPAAFPVYTAKWGDSPANKCNYCHGNKTYAGITAAMPNQGASNSHPRHVVTEKFRCYVCHSNVVNSAGAIVSTSNHVNGFKNISIITTYKTANENYSDGTDRCSNIKCHGGRMTPVWGSAANCTDCHYTATGATTAEDSFGWTNFSGTSFAAAKVYSTEWMKRGHGKTKVSGKYPFSNNTGAGKICDNCHRKEVSHNQSNYFRIITANGNSAANPDLLCARCHGTGTQLQTGFGRITGIVNHTYANMSTYGGYKGGQNGKAGWNITPKCVDCHDPHGDSNNSMLHAYINMTGSDSYGKPTPTTGQGLVTYTAVGGQVSWSSFARSDKNGICQRCHSSEVDFFDKAQYGNPANTHNNGSPCKNCHKHKKGFSPSGCDSCHGDSTRNMGRANNGPPKGPSGWSDSMTNKSSLHQPHAYNPRSRPGFNNKTGFDCQRCHDDALPAGNHNSGKNRANMNNMTSTSGYGGYNSQSKIAFGNDTTKNPADDTCWNTKCHTPRSYTRTWKKPTDCDDCHGTIRLRGATERAYKLHTTNSHKIHINYTGASNLAAGIRNYRFACSNCHYTVTNYSTHYSGLVNITSNGPINTVGGQFYARGRSFKGFTTGGEVTGTSYCTKTYCHGNFANGTTTTRPSWKKGATPLSCGSCHKAKTAKVTNWQNGTSMPARHPKHVRTATYNFACSNCHVRTVTNNTTVYSQYSAHVNGQVNVAFGSMSGTFNSGTKRCTTSYCHSRGNTQAFPYSYANYTARWDQTATQITGSGKECSLCHGNKTYAGITAAMPRQATFNSHSTHVLKGKFRCYVCHANVVNSAGAIISYTNHVNKFKNISIIATYKTANEGYVDGTDKCSNVKCHGGRTTPAWGSSANCTNCHYSTADVDDKADFRNWSGTVAKVYSSQWVGRGHGKPSAGAYSHSTNSGAGLTCTSCHRASVSHGTASNPYRLYTAPNRPDDFCRDCHDGTPAKNVVSHTKNAMQTAGYNGGATGWGAWDLVPKCVDCHDPHGDNNNYMVHKQINYTTSSNTYGVPAQTVQLTFTTAGAGSPVGGDYVNPSPFDGICQRCHSSNQSTVENYRKDLDSGHNVGTRCTNCHGHDKGFYPVATESTGSSECQTCHSSLFNPMNNQASSYHHVMQNTSATGGSKYPTANNISSIDPRRRCLMCHADHDIFNPAVNTNTPLGRAGNLRESITVTPNATADTGFAKSDFIKDSTKEGICISCHKIAQTKNKTRQFSDNSNKTLRITYAQYSTSPHSYVVPSSRYVDANASGDTSRFDANCVKCHNDTMTKTKFKASTSFGVHDSQLRRINSKLGLTMDSGTATAGAATTLTDSTKSWVANEWGGQPVTITSGTGVGQTRVVASNTPTVLTMTKSWTTNPNATSTYTIGDPVEENYCYNCHGVSQNPNFAIGKDYYGVATYVNTKALKMEQTFNGIAGSVTAAAVGPPTTITDSTKSWSSNQWAGYIIKITSGKRAGSEGEILSNTATQVTLVTPWSKVPAAADEYSIGNPFRHRIDNFGGQHKSDEGLSAPAGLTTFGWFTAVGTKLHVGCADCHNPHAQRKPASDRGTSSTTQSTISTVVDTTKSWTANQWVGFKLVPASRSQIGSERVIISNTATKLKVDAVFSTKLTGVYYYINPLGRAKVATAAPATQKGNMLNGPNNGQWGAKPTAWPTPTPSATADVDAIQGPTTFSKVTTMTSGTNYIYELCFKCHSQYGWGTSGTPFNTMGGNNGSEGPSTHIAAEFNPNNLAHHALVDIGKNQPITATGQTVGTASYYNTNWPKYNAATIGITTAGVATFSTNVFNIVKSVIPGWYLYAGSNAPGPGLTQNWYQITEITGANTAKVTPAPGTAVSAGTASFLTAGLGNNFVPPYGPWSVISCADCHDTDGASDPKGPHGSGQKWLLKGLRKQTFTWWNGTANQTTSYGPSSANFTSDNGKMICLNCHRADVYGFNQQTPSNGTAPAAGDDISNFTWKATWAREQHTPDDSDGRSGIETYNIFGIYCMNCHLGQAMGQVHGTSMGKSLDESRTVIATGASYRGKRFLTGGAWTGVVRGEMATSGTSQCYVQAVGTAINSCNDNATGDFPVGKSNYDYQTGTDY